MVFPRNDIPIKKEAVESDNYSNLYQADFFFFLKPASVADLPVGLANNLHFRGLSVSFPLGGHSED